MTDIYRVRSVWSGFPGGPGVTTMFFLDVATAVASVHTFWTDISDRLPLDVHVQVQNVGDIINDETGDMTGAWSAESVTVVNGASDNPYAAPVGACINWLTETIAHARRLRGRTFIVPISNQDFQSDGSLGAAPRADILAAAEALIESQSLSFVVWHRGTGTDGSNGLITAATVPDKAVVLRSRRD